MGGIHGARRARTQGRPFRKAMSAVIPISPVAAPGTRRSSLSPSFEYLSTKKDELIGWARKFSIFPYPFVTACCAMEFMAVSSTPYDTDRFGAALPRFSPRQSDLLMVVGTITTSRRLSCSRYTSRCASRSG
jgi:hypothetical protein